MARKKDETATEVAVVAKPTEVKAVPAYELADRFKKSTGIIVGHRIVNVQDGKVVADDELHKVLMEGGFLK